MAIKINGTNSNSAVGLNNGDEDSGIKPGSNTVEIVTGGSTRVKVDSSGRALIGGNEPVTANHGSAKLQVNNDGDRVASFMYANDDGAGPHVNIVKSRGGTTDLSNRKVLNNNDELGRLNFIGDDGNDLGSDGAAIIAKIDGTVTSNQMPTELNFHVNNSTQFAEERMRLTKTGSLEVYKGTGNTGKTAGQEAFRVGNGGGNFRFSVYPDGTTVIGGSGTITSNNIQLTNDGTIKVASGGGIDFSANANATGMLSELLDDYEEGTWTPTVSGATLNGAAIGRYIKVGKLVTLWYNCNSTNVTGTGGTDIEIAGIPFAVGNSHSVAGSVRVANGLDFSGYLTVNRNGAATAITFLRQFTDSNAQTLEFGDLAGNFFHLTGSYTYEST